MVKVKYRISVFIRPCPYANHFVNIAHTVGLKQIRQMTGIVTVVLEVLLINGQVVKLLECLTIDR